MTERERLKMLRASLRNLCETTLGELEALDALDTAPDPDPNAPCAHPPDKRRDISTMGNPGWLCTACHYIHEGKEGE